MASTTRNFLPSSWKKATLIRIPKSAGLGNRLGDFLFFGQALPI
jgi:hypothetical protein